MSELVGTQKAKTYLCENNIMKQYSLMIFHNKKKLRKHKRQ